jgi:hypothetical protein
VGPGSAVHREERCTASGTLIWQRNHRQRNVTSQTTVSTPS